jgi:hypothetical protein
MVTQQTLYCMTSKTPSSSDTIFPPNTSHLANHKVTSQISLLTHLHVTPHVHVCDTVGFGQILLLTYLGMLRLVTSAKYLETGYILHILLRIRHQRELRINGRTNLNEFLFQICGKMYVQYLFIREQETYYMHMQSSLFLEHPCSHLPS